MFRVILYCDDKKLSELLRAVSGLALSSPAPEAFPIVDVEVQRKGNSGYAEMFIAHCHKHNITEFAPPQGREITKAIGLSPSSSNYVYHKLMKVGALKKRGKSSATRYTVVA